MSWRQSSTFRLVFCGNMSAVHVVWQKGTTSFLTCIGKSSKSNKVVSEKGFWLLKFLLIIDETDIYNGCKIMNFFQKEQELIVHFYCKMQ